MGNSKKPMRRFEDSTAWQTAADLAVAVYDLTDRSEFGRKASLRNQLERATLSISSNIAEGFERGSNTELLQFPYIARGSAAEVRSMFLVIERIATMRNLSAEVTQLTTQVESISRQLYAWCQSLQNSGIKGHKFLNDQTRANYSNKNGFAEPGREADICDDSESLGVEP